MHSPSGTGRWAGLRRALQDSGRLTPNVGRLRLLALAVVLVFVILASLHAGNAPLWTAVEGTGEVLVGMVAVLACAMRLERERSLYASAVRMQQAGSADASAVSVQRQAQTAWTLLTAAVCAWTVGEIAWTFSEVVMGIEPQAPSPLDVIFLTFSVLLVGGLLAMVRTPAGHLSHLRGVVEGLFIASGFLLCSWSLVIGPVLSSSHSSAAAGAINLAYPVLDAVALAAVYFVVLRRRACPPAGLGLLALGIFGLGFSDSAYWYLTETHPEFPGVSPLDAGWIAAFLLIAIAALTPERPRRRRRRDPGRGLALVLPSLPATVGIPIVVSTWLLSGNVESAVPLAIMAVVVGLGLALLVIVTYENDALTNDLERRVRERTAELHETERYYRALVKQSSDAVIVVDSDLRIRYVSDSIETIFGYRPEDLSGQRLGVFGRDGAARLTEALGGLVQPDHLVRVDWRLTDATGRQRCAESTITDLLSDPHVKGFVLNTRDATDRFALTDQLRHQAFHDPLTHLPNRALLSDRASQTWARSQRAGTSVAVMAIDLDGFKLVNDEFGHHTGDLLLQALAQQLMSAMRPGDTAARLGGDEFVVLMDAVTGGDDARAFAERILGALSAEMDLEGRTHRITASIGVAVNGAPGRSFEQLLCDADAALYAVKAAGRNAVQLFAPGMQLQSSRRFKLQSDLRRAIENEEFWLLYQPQFGAGDKRLTGFQAVIRWNHPEHGLISSDRFLPLAEESGLAVPLGRWTLAEALDQADAWDHDDSRAGPMSISVGISPAQLNAPSLLADVRATLERSEIDPYRVVLAIGESALVDCSEHVTEVLWQLKELGVRLAIDGYGTGYASVSQLKSMPIDVLKIDPGLIASTQDAERRRELLGAIVRIGHALSLVVIADGIERPSQLAAAREAGCDLAQGYLLGRPLPSEEAQRVIAECGAPSGRHLQLAARP